MVGWVLAARMNSLEKVYVLGLFSIRVYYAVVLVSTRLTIHTRELSLVIVCITGRMCAHFQ